MRRSITTAATVKQNDKRRKTILFPQNDNARSGFGVNVRKSPSPPCKMPQAVLHGAAVKMLGAINLGGYTKEMTMSILRFRHLSFGAKVRGLRGMRCSGNKISHSQVLEEAFEKRARTGVFRPALAFKQPA